jgi:hypothetical protein
MTQSFPGSCFCGAVKYRMTAAPMFVHCCHCRDCQKQTGGAFVINALVEADRVEILEGAPVGITMPTESGKPHVCYRCPRCQTALWSTYGGRHQIRFVRVPTLDQPHDIVPDVHIFTRSKVSWVTLPAGVRSFDVYYEAKKEWPEESLERRAKAMAGP